MRSLSMILLVSNNLAKRFLFSGIIAIYLLLRAKIDESALRKNTLSSLEVQDFVPTPPFENAPIP